MLRTISKISFAIAALAMLPVNPAQASTSRVRVDIPFGFVAGDQVLPAGRYFVDLLENSRMMTLQGSYVSVRIPVRGSGIRREPGRNGSGALLFEKTGRIYVLRHAWNPNRVAGCTLYPSSQMERELSRATEAAVITAAR